MWHALITGASITKVPFPDVLDVANALLIPTNANNRDNIRKVNTHLGRWYINLSPPNAEDTKDLGIISAIKSPLVAGGNLTPRKVTRFALPRRPSPRRPPPARQDRRPRRRQSRVLPRLLHPLHCCSRDKGLATGWRRRVEDLPTRWFCGSTRGMFCMVMMTTREESHWQCRASESFDIDSWTRYPPPSFANSSDGTRSIQDTIGSWFGEYQ